MYISLYIYMYHYTLYIYMYHIQFLVNQYSIIRVIFFGDLEAFNIWASKVDGYDHADYTAKTTFLRLCIIFGWWFELLWKIWKSIGMIIPNIWENKKCSKPPTRLYMCWRGCAETSETSMQPDRIPWLENMQNPCDLHDQNEHSMIV